MRCYSLIAVAFIASILCLFPLWFGPPQGDLLHQYAMTECYGKQLWTGHFYPRWCMNTNAGYGSPMPIFYFPLPYYVAAVFYPLRYFGLDIPDIYQVVVFATHLLTFAGMYVWLRALVAKPIHAALGAALFLLLPYRMELIYFRAAYSELFCLALVPWLLLCARSGVSINSKKTLWLTLIVALGLLSHPSVIAMAYAAGFFYMLIVSGGSICNIRGYIAAGLFAVLITGFHWVEMQHFIQFLHKDNGGVSWLQGVWVNQFANEITEPTIRPLFIAHIATLLVGVVVFLLFRPVGKEIICLAVLALLATVMAFSVSAPIWWILEPIMQVKIPWRMFSFPSFFVAAVIAASMGGARFRIGAYAAALIAISLSGLVMPAPKHVSEELRALVVSTQRVLAFATPRWVDMRYDDENPEAFFRDFVFERPRANANLSHGGEVNIIQWNDDGIIIDVNSAQPGRLVIEHFYFHIWHAKINGRDAELKPVDDGTGRMFVTVPLGKSRVVLKAE